MVAQNLKTWTREEYDKLAELGVLNPDERLELVDGQIVRKVTHHPPHFSAIKRFGRWLGSFAEPAYSVRAQGPIALSDTSEPEPDVLVAVGPDEAYDNRHPEPHEVALLIEVSHSSIDRDRRIKIPLYAQAGIREFWILDIDSRKLEVRRNPVDGKFRSLNVLDEFETASPLFAPENHIVVSELLPNLASNPD